MPKPCASCLSRPRRLVCLRCGDALCRRCAGQRACSCVLRVGVEPPAYTAPVAPRPPCYDCGSTVAARSACPLCGKTVCRECAEKPYASCCGAQPTPQPSSAVPSDAAPPVRPSTPRRAEQPPVTSTTKPVAPGAGDGRPAVPAMRAPRAGTISACALELAAAGPFNAVQLAQRTGRDLTVCTTVCAQLKKAGKLQYTRAAGGGRARMQGARGVYSLPGAPLAPVAEQSAARPRNMLEPLRARVGDPAADPEAELARYGVRRLAPEQAATSVARAPVTGVHRTVADFFADKPKLPSARPVTPRYA